MQSLTFKNGKTFYVDFSKDQIKCFWKNLYRDLLYEANKVNVGYKIPTVGSLGYHVDKTQLLTNLKEYEKDIFKIVDDPIYLESSIHDITDSLKFNSNGFLRLDSYADLYYMNQFAIWNEFKNYWETPVLRFQPKSRDLLELRIKKVKEKDIKKEFALKK